jgi:hypothetical protein
MTSGTWDKIRLETTPSGAKVTDEFGVHLATTPGYITIKRRKAAPKLTFSKEGYEDVNVQLSRKLNKKSSLNLLYTALGLLWVAESVSENQKEVPVSGGFLIGGVYAASGYVIDLLTGAIWDHDKSIRLTMVKTETD